MAQRELRSAGRFTGPGFPFKASIFGTLGPRSDIEVIYASIVNIILTRVGTIPYNPTLGAEVIDLLFEPLDEITLALVRYFTEKALIQQEPRIVVRNVRTETRRDDPHFVGISVAFSIIGDPEERTYAATVSFDNVGI